MDVKKLWKSIENDYDHPLNLCMEKRDSYSKLEMEKIDFDLTTLLETPRSPGVDSLMKRLAIPHEFAGARLELEIASHFKRYGFNNLNLKPKNKIDIELPTNPPIYVEISLQHYPDAEKRLDRNLALGIKGKIELSDEEILKIVKSSLDHKFKQLKEKDTNQIIMILDFGYSESYERVIKNNIKNFNIPSFIICILFRTKSNILKFNDSFSNEKIGNILSSLSSPSCRASSLWGRN